MPAEKEAVDTSEFSCSDFHWFTCGFDCERVPTLCAYTRARSKQLLDDFTVETYPRPEGISKGSICENLGR